MIVAERKNFRLVERRLDFGDGSKISIKISENYLRILRSPAGTNYPEEVEISRENMREVYEQLGEMIEESEAP